MYLQYKISYVGNFCIKTLNHYSHIICNNIISIKNIKPLNILRKTYIK